MIIIIIIIIIINIIFVVVVVVVVDRLHRQTNVKPTGLQSLTD